MKSAKFLLLSASAYGICAAAPAYAQDETGEPAASRGGAPIIVTAQRREENVQDVPIAVSAISAEALADRGISDISDLSGIAPNVTLDGGTPFSASSSVLSAYIRGIGANDFAFNIDPGVGIYLDGVYLARTVGANQDLLDVERIEVLRGPQGTLFGRNTIGGAVNVVTRAPGDEFMFRGDITTGSYDRIQVRGTVDVPLTEGLAMSVTGGFHDRDGYVRRIPYTGPGSQFIGNHTPSSDFMLAGYDTDDTEGGDHTWNLRGRVDYDNGGRFRASFTGDYSSTDTNQLPNTVLLTTEFIPGPFAGLNQFNLGPALGFPIQTGLDVITGSSGFLFGGLYNFCINASPADLAARSAANLCGGRTTVSGGFSGSPPLADPVTGGVNFDADPTNDLIPLDGRFIVSDIDTSYATGPSFSDLETWGGAGTLEFDISDNITLKSITAYRELHWDAAMDLDGAPYTALQVSFSMNQWQFSEELQLLGSALDGDLDFVLGAYYFKEAGDLHDYVPFIEGLLQVDGPNDLWTENYALFGQIDWRYADWGAISVGGRYTHENKEFEGGQSDRNGFNYDLFNCLPPFNNPLCTALVGFNDPNEPLRYFIAGIQEKEFDNFSPRVSLQFFPNDDIMFYGTWSRGYKTGGWTTRLSNPLPTAPDFDEEEAESFEVGLKAYLFDRIATLNLAAFTTEYTGIQLNFQQGVSPTIQNAGTARINGFEAEFSIAPTEVFRLDVSLGAIDAEYTSVLPQSVVAPSPLQAGVFEGADLPKTPSVTINVSPSVRLPLDGLGSLTFVADYTYTSSLWNDTERTFLLRRPEVHNLNANITYRPENERFSITAGVTNLLDERYLITGQAQIAGGFIYGTYSRPMEWYLRAGVEF